MIDRSTLAAIRFGTGLSPVIPPPAGAGEVLVRLGGPDAAARAHPQPGWVERAFAARDLIRLRRARRDGGPAEAAAYKAHVQAMGTAHHRDLARALTRAVVTHDGMRERLAWFWADHFAVTQGRGLLRGSVAGYHEDAIRPHLTGRFADLVTAAVTHPAMQAFLDQNGSIGPNSPRGRRGGGLNENLAREVLELHTLGAGGPYGQADVRQLAELLTGLGFGRDLARTFRPNRAEPGPERVLGRSYGGATADADDIRAVLHDLAVHPATARHLSRKLAVHFVADRPDPGLVDAMARAWLDGGGDLMAVYGAMLSHPAAWTPELRKVRRPIEMIAAGLRALGLDDRIVAASRRQIRRLATGPVAMMGQRWTAPPGPQGWPEAGGAWITPQALAARIDWAMRAPEAILGAGLPDPRAFVDTALGPLATPRTRFAAGAAEDRAAGVGLVLAAPEFQRR